MGKDALQCYLYSNKDLCNIKFYLIIKGGSNSEMKDQNGIAHLLEHMFIPYMNSTSENEFIVDKFKYRGVTNFNRTEISICSLENNRYTIENGLSIIDNIIKGKMPNKDFFELVKKDVIDECRYFEEKNEKQKEVLSFITNKEIERVPMGKIEDIEKISLEDLSIFHKKEYLISNMALVIIGDINIQETKKHIKEKFGFMENREVKSFNDNYVKKYIGKSYNKILTLKGLNSGCNKVNFFYRVSSGVSTFKGVIIRYLFENLFKEYITNKRQDIDKLFYTHKYINEEYNFYIITYKLEKYNEFIEEYDDIINQLKLSGFNDEKYISEKDKLIGLIGDIVNEDVIVSPDEVYKVYLNNFLYNEPILFIKQDGKLILDKLNNITLDDINNFMKSIFDCKNKIVIES